MAALPKRKRKRKRGLGKAAGARKRAREQHPGVAKLRKQHGSTFEDRISELPDDLLITILGHLDTRSSAATSVLSRRWQHLWKSVPKLRFSQHDIVPQTELSRFLRAHEYVFFKPSLCSWKRRVRVNLDRRIRLTDMYRTRIFSSSLTGFLHKSNAGDKNNTKISSLFLSCTMEDRYVNLVDKLVSIAVCRGVEDLNLTTSFYYDGQRRSTTPYEFPLSLFTDGKGLSLTELKLCECTLNIPIGFDGFKSLVKLSLTRMPISEDMIHTLFENCLKLECFHLNHCWGANHLFAGPGANHLKIASHDLQLRDIMVNSCEQITHMELVAPKLHQFRYRGPSISMMLGSVPSIEHACLHYEDSRDGESVKYILGKLSQDFPLLTSLSIDFDTYELKNPVIPGGLPTAFKNLRSLMLRVTMHSNDDLAWATMLLEVAPALESFQIEFISNKKREHPGGVLWEPSDFEHHRLRQVKFYRFRMRQGDVALAGLLLARAPLLQTMSFFHGFVHNPPNWITQYVEAYHDWSTEQQSAITRRLEACNTFGARLEFRS
ncbi:putative FBD-associated F-box protein At5g56690 [Oryza glaberrima]|uniref:F-box domain-containing protein n=1 Tax=Oryza glaberrima TaxID=4538 RepID=I1QBH5_ORYGL|nr:putative FBD-associated F-box protein At5g56690 [Oryza glaberrima]